MCLVWRVLCLIVRAWNEKGLSVSSPLLTRACHHRSTHKPNTHTHIHTEGEGCDVAQLGRGSQHPRFRVGPQVPAVHTALLWEDDGGKEQSFVGVCVCLDGGWVHERNAGM